MSREVVVLCGCGQRNRLRRFHGGPFFYQCLDCGAPIAEVEPLSAATIGKHIATGAKWSVGLVALAGLLHVLTQPAASPGLPIGTVAARAKPTIAAPDSGVLRRRTDNIVTVSFEADPATSYAVRLVEISTMREEMVLFVAAGESVETLLRPGQYRITAATGAQWINSDELFGPETTFYRLEPRDGEMAAVSLAHGEAPIIRLKSGPASALLRTRIDRHDF